ncbi:MAG TPA: HNH endonuclease [Myxococcaceae bacterium]|nr:HNH endonuclease [Myxococcaceae bacterium]
MTFEKKDARGQAVWIGRCLHCNAHLTIAEDGTPLSRASVEHIVPQSQGGTDEPLNLGLACARCNHLKGVHHDRKGLNDARGAEVIERLLRRRRDRYRESGP